MMLFLNLKATETAFILRHGHSMFVNGEHRDANNTLENLIKDIELMVTEAQSNGESEMAVSGVLEHNRKAKQEVFTGLSCSLLAAVNSQRHRPT